MNTKNLKAYAPKARRQFIEAVKKRAAQFGIYEDRIEEVRIEGGAAIIEGRAFTRKEGEQRKRLESKVTERGYDMFVREMAYTWFNRLAAIRYMELHDYFDHGFRVLSHPTNSESLPEILSHASDVADSLNLDKSHIIELQLAGDKEEELYRELLLGQCHHLHKIMPFMFEALDDATELLLPNNLTKTDSILKGLINDIPEEDWQEIEVIGWLYQFYISEHKDAVIGKVVKSEDIPAATQLFTPNWIVKYLVQNSVGRQWLATYPDSELKSKMEYYIEPAEQSEEVIEQLKAITPTSIDPEEIKVLDPACGSGHILVEVYEVLREIYLERGYRLREIPELILTKNIYGLDIDDRAAQLAGFALMMKAREDDRRIFQRVEGGEVSLNVFSLQSTEHLDIPKLWKALDLEGAQQTGATGGLFETTEEFVQPTGIYKEYFELIQELKSSFLQAKTLGSLIKVEHQKLNNLFALKEALVKTAFDSDPAAKQAAVELFPIINQALCLAQQYDALVANPPYMGRKYQNNEVKSYLKDNFTNNEKDLFSAFICRNLDLTKPSGYLGFMTPFVWMFISSYEHLRNKILSTHSIGSLIQLEYGGFEGATVAVCSFTLMKEHLENHVGSYIRLSEFKGVKNQQPKTLEAIRNPSSNWFYQTNQNSYSAIPGKPIAYWAQSSVLDSFKCSKVMRDISHSFQGMITGNNDYFLRYWWEINYNDIVASSESYGEVKGVNCWVPYSKGGGFRKWFGNNDHVIRWNGYGDDMVRGRTENRKHFFKEGLTWSDIASSLSSFRLQPKSTLFDAKGPTAVYNDNEHIPCIGLMNSVFSQKIIEMLNPSVSFQLEEFNKIPIALNLTKNQKLIVAVESSIDIAKKDWNSKEERFEFEKSSLLNENEGNLLKNSYMSLLESNKKLVKKLMSLEVAINQEVSKEYSFDFDEDDFLSTNLISLDCNPVYAYGSKLTDEEYKQRQQSDELQNLVSFSLGCMMGRFSLDREGLVFANSGNEGVKELEAKGAFNTYPADDDGIIPLASEEWLFDDDATTRFKEFVKTVWGDEHLSENLEFVAESLCLHALKPLSTKKGSGESAMDTIRRYFSTQFFKDHCKTYKKRPIYWLFSSGKEKAFECLVYLHRYNEGTLSRMRTEYVTPLMGKYDAQHVSLSEQHVQATGTEARRIEKDIKSLEKKQAELRIFDEQLKHYAEKRITLDLDDGVKANYGKFGNLLADVKAIHGKAVK
ncbi:BREX-1 system adenine-specific DNA-methyltransferase PglX [Pseudoalteromonas sp. T1lg76]|uniref:BREX-1 system adenine-specific DNA-methyltransferase PglX n=1 Tax=Pseudoalteromonas sp. T1lg76 TaxID=2077103 RepID=UPI000CF6FD27|nr:BREX-1 system adenine-specific DNA-methyltransferase PglX [Pseudoalteromonas sp. T1lg76]